MLASRGDFDPVTGKYGYYCVMGPDEFQMMVHHNAYTNFMGQKTLRYTLETLAQMDEASLAKLNVTPEEMADWKHKADSMYIPYDEDTKLFEQHMAISICRSWTSPPSPQTSSPCIPTGRMSGSTATA